MCRTIISSIRILMAVILLVTAAGCAAPLQESDDVYEPADGIRGEPGEDLMDIEPEMIPLTESPAMFVLPMPAAPGSDVRGNATAEIDVSNTKDGYVMVRYIPRVSKQLRVLIKGPSGTTYTYELRSGGKYEVYPLSDGNGAYQIGVYENVSGDRYATVISATENVRLIDEFAPFLRPNQYVNYTAHSKTIEKSAEITGKCTSATEKIAAVYHYVTGNISYDKQLAANIKSGAIRTYLPDVDKALKSGKGICFDYAAVMTAMLRGQGIPTKLVVGYTGSVYHAWISTYSDDTGWIDGVIYFDGVSWKLMDPTFASSGGKEISSYIGDGKNYSVKYLY